MERCIDGDIMTSAMIDLTQLKPAVKKVWLQLVAGLMWFSVGTMLISLTFQWLKPVVFFSLLLLITTGLLLAVLIYYFGFSKLAIKNIKRIKEINNEKVCFFAFQKWSSYPLILFMIFLGIFLRTYTPIPKPLLAILYIGIGGGLLSSSLHYFRHIWQEHFSKSFLK